MRTVALLFLSSLLVSACGPEEGARLSGLGGAILSADGQTIVSEHLGAKGIILTDEFLESTEGEGVAAVLRRIGVRYLSVLTGDDVPFQRAGMNGIQVPAWKRTRWALDVGPLSAVSHSSGDLRLVQFGRAPRSAHAIARWLDRFLVQGPALPEGGGLVINGYADCFIARSGSVGNGEDQLSTELRDKAGCRRVNILNIPPRLAITKQLDQWVRFFSNDVVAVARLVNLGGDLDIGDSPSLVKLRQFWDDEARSMGERGYEVVRLPVFVHHEREVRLFSSMVAGVLIEGQYVAPHFPTLSLLYSERYRAEQIALERELRILGLKVEWISGEESARLGGSLHRAVLPVHEK